MTNCYVSTVTSVIHLTHWVQSSNNVGSGTKYRRSCRRIAVLEWQANAIFIVDTRERNVSGLHGHGFFGKVTILRPIEKIPNVMGI
ncbi:hypothetical protein T4E_9914 [Trichinella pseudospiralis]|uniref:Uncharacterized protein n=1 Tax=Trichinella pseudospiralis TaxID=6337 RepID=A0A0V0XTN7_TRIPS|nr:hypothetical protein T4E_9914 [Trichinella pseudospiralis]